MAQAWGSGPPLLSSPRRGRKKPKSARADTCRPPIICGTWPASLLHSHRRLVILASLLSLLPSFYIRSRVWFVPRLSRGRFAFVDVLEPGKISFHCVVPKQ